MSSDNARLRPHPGFRQIGTGMSSAWTCVLCQRRSFTHQGRRRVLGSYACAPKCEVKT